MFLLLSYVNYGFFVTLIPLPLVHLNRLGLVHTLTKAKITVSKGMCTSKLLIFEYLITFKYSLIHLIQICPLEWTCLMYYIVSLYYLHTSSISWTMHFHLINICTLIWKTTYIPCMSTTHPIYLYPNKQTIMDLVSIATHPTIQHTSKQGYCWCISHTSSWVWWSTTK